MKLTLISVLALVLSAGCSKKDGAAGGGDDGKVASCLMESVQGCREYRGGNLAMGTDMIKDLCTTVIKTAKFSDTPCPTEKIVGTCAKPEGKDFFYEGGTDDAAKIEANCKQGGGTFGTK